MTYTDDTDLRQRLHALVREEAVSDLVWTRIERGVQRRRVVRRMGQAAIGVAAILLALVIVHRPGPAHKNTVTVTSEPSLSTTTMATTTLATTTTVTAPATTVIQETPTTGHHAPSATPASDLQPLCVDSFDPVCGAFRWIDTPPVNTPIRVSVEPNDLRVKAGQAAVFHVTVADDAQITRVDPLWDGCYVNDGAVEPSISPPSVCLGTALQLERSGQPHVGAWHSPAPFADGSTDTVTFTHTFTTPGIHSLRIEASSLTAAWAGADGLNDRDTDPYRSDATVEFTITVDP